MRSWRTPESSKSQGRFGILSDFKFFEFMKHVTCQSDRWTPTPRNTSQTHPGGVAADFPGGKSEGIVLNNTSSPKLAHAAYVTVGNLAMGALWLMLLAILQGTYHDACTFFRRGVFWVTLRNVSENHIIDTVTRSPKLRNYHVVNRWGLDWVCFCWLSHYGSMGLEYLHNPKFNRLPLKQW